MITKFILRTEIRELLLQQMIHGKLTPGSRISLPNLAESLQVSVTPIREALTQLTETGIVTYIANRGFFVKALTEIEAANIYEIISLLESNAISSILYDDAHLSELQEINTRFKAANNASEQLQVDMDFHKKLIEGHTNKYLLKIIEDIRVRICMYEHVFMSSQSPKASIEHHKTIIECLKKNDKKTAIKTLVSNWKLSIDHIKKSYHLNATV